MSVAMSAKMSRTLFLPDDDATAAMGARLAAMLRAGDLVTLSGELGAGKSALARALIRARLGEAGLDVPSPTFSLVQPYADAGGRTAILHADLYRLADDSELAELGLLDDPDAIVLVEWPERAPALLARADIRLTLAIPTDGEGRVLSIDGADDREWPG